jgi:hypothetical protein
LEYSQGLGKRKTFEIVGELLAGQGLDASKKQAYGEKL